MKILAVQETDWMKRGPHPQHHFLERLAQRGHLVRVIHYPLNWRNTYGDNTKGTPIIVNGVHRVTSGPGVTLITPPFVRLPGLDLPSMAASHAIVIRREVRDFAPDVVMGLSILNSFVAMRIAQRLDIPFVYQTIDALPELVPWKRLKGLARAFVSANYRGAERILLISDALVEFAMSLGADESKCFVIPAGVDLELYSSPDNKKALRQQLGLESTDFVLGYLGYVYPSSGLTELLPGIAGFKSDGAKVKLLVIGDGEGTEKLLSIARSMGISDRVIVTGWQSYELVPALLDLCSIFVFPGIDSDLLRHVVPMKFYEYLAAGKPVVSTRLEGIAREFHDCRAVHLVSEPDEVAKAALSLLYNPEERRLEGEIGRNFVRERRGWSRLTELLERCLDEVITLKRSESIP